jgi:hypothetical protein
MSSLLEQIARRRRASALRRLGPPPGTFTPAPPRPAPPTRAPEPPPRTSLEPIVEPAPAVVDPEPVVAEPEPAVEPEPVVAEPEPVPVVEPAPPPRYESWLPEPELVAPPLATPEPVLAPQPAPTPEPPPAHPSFRERGQLRRRARYLRRVRELQLRDIGGFELELHRAGTDRPDLVQAKIDNAARTDEELRTLELALDRRVPLRELREPGIGGVCSECGAVHGSHDRFCASCGNALPTR